MTHTILTLIALLALLPAAVLPFRAAAKRDTLFWLTIMLAAVVPLLWVGVTLSGPWQTALGAAVWSSVAITVILFAIVAGRTSTGWRLAPLLMPYLILLGVLASFLPDGLPLPAGHESVWLWVHIGLSLLTYGLLTLSAIAGLAVIVQDYALKRKRPNRLSRLLPAVVDGDRLSWRLLLASELVLGLGLVTGLATLYMETGHLWKLDHKTILTVLAFVLIGLLLFGHRACGVRGRLAARVVLSAWLLLSLAWFGVKFVTQFLL